MSTEQSTDKLRPDIDDVSDEDLVDYIGPIVEPMRGLEELPDRGPRICAVPVQVEALGTFPVRACGTLEN